MKHKHPETSHEAWNSVKDTPMLSDHHNKIIEGLTKIGNGYYEEIALASNLTNEQCHKRLSELERLGLIEKDGNKKKTSSGRNAFCYRIVPPKKVDVGVSKVVQIGLFG